MLCRNLGTALLGSQPGGAAFVGGPGGVGAPCSRALTGKDPRPVNNLPNRTHPPWCLRGVDCATMPDSAAWHSSRLLRAAAAEYSCVDIAVGRWQLDSAEIRPVPTCPAVVLAGGVLLEFRLGDDVDQWPVDGAQALAPAHLIPQLLRGDAAPRPDHAVPRHRRAA
jgi:hypothetical protein